jgi:hypothetical protein
MKKFLPTNNNRDVEMALMHNVGKNVYKETTVREDVPRVGKAKSWIMKIFSTITLVGLIFGGTFVGLSVKIVEDDHYYKSDTSEPGYVGPGIYLHFWTKEKMNIVDINNSMFLRKMKGTLDNQIFLIDKAYVAYSATNVDVYVETLKKLSFKYCQGEIERAIIHDIINSTAPEDLSSVNELSNIDISKCGITVNEVQIISLIITDKKESKSKGNEEMERDSENEEMERDSGNGDGRIGDGDGDRDMIPLPGIEGDDNYVVVVKNIPSNLTYY